MKSINYLIVELDEAYENEVEVSTGDSVIVNSTIEDISHVKRIATVIEAPDFTILKKGDKVIVHQRVTHTLRVLFYGLQDGLARLFSKVDH